MRTPIPASRTRSSNLNTNLRPLPCVRPSRYSRATSTSFTLRPGALPRSLAQECLISSAPKHRAPQESGQQNCALSKWDAANSLVERWEGRREAEPGGGTKRSADQSHASSRPTKRNSQENWPEAWYKRAKFREDPYGAVVHYCLHRREDGGIYAQYFKQHVLLVSSVVSYTRDQIRKRRFDKIYRKIYF